VQQKTGEIKERMKRTAQDIVEIGQRLIEVKERLGHGRFGKWLKAEFGWGTTTAWKFMRVGEQFKFSHCENIAPSALYLLAAPSTPDEVRREALERAYQGESITHAKVKKLVAGRKVKRNSKKSKVVDTPLGTTSNSADESVLPRPTVEQEFVLGEWVEVLTPSGNATWDGLRGSVTRVEQHEITVQLDDGKWKHLRFYRDELVKVPAPNDELNRMIESTYAETRADESAQGSAKSFFRVGDLVLIDCPARAEKEYKQWNGCWGLVKSVGQLGSVEVAIAGETMRFPPSDLEIIDNPSPIFVEVASKVVQLLKRNDLDECERYLLMGFYLRRQTFTQRQLEMLEDLINHYENSDNIHWSASALLLTVRSRSHHFRPDCNSQLNIAARGSDGLAPCNTIAPPD
jgi:hypothetical protein